MIDEYKEHKEVEVKIKYVEKNPIPVPLFPAQISLRASWN
jgi:hypothetical protein